MTSDERISLLLKMNQSHLPVTAGKVCNLNPFCTIFWALLAEFWQYGCVDVVCLSIFECGRSVEEFSWIFPTISSLVIMTILPAFEDRLPFPAVLVLLILLYGLKFLSVHLNSANDTFPVFFYIFVHTALECLVFNMFSVPKQFQIYQLREYILSFSLLFSIMLNIFPLSKQSLMQIFPLSVVCSTNGILMILSRVYPEVCTPERSFITLNIVSILTNVLGLLVGHYGEDIFDFGMSFSGYNPFQASTLISVMQSVASVHIFNVFYNWRFEFAAFNGRNLSIGTESITKSYRSAISNSIFDDRRFLLVLMYSIFFFLTVGVLCTRSSLYCPLNYYDEPVKDQPDVIRTHKGSIDFQDVIENFYIKLIACDILLIYLSATLVPLAIPRGLLFISYFTLGLFGDVATMAVISCNQSRTIYFAICYKFAHIGLGYLTLGSQIASDGNDDIFELKEHLLWLSILFNLICFTPNKSNFVVLMSIMSSFFCCLLGNK